MAYKFKMDSDFIKIITKALESSSASAPVCPILLGEPGIGKSSIVRALCEENDWAFFELLCNQLGDRADLTGCRTVKELVLGADGKEHEVWKQVFFPHQSIQDAIEYAKNNPNQKVILFLDEINRTTSDITSAILSFPTARTVGSVRFPDNISFILAGNDKGNVVAIDSASITRFIKYPLKPDAKAWMEYETKNNRLNPYIEQVLKSNPDLIFCKPVNTVSSTVQGDDGDDIATEYEAFDDVSEGFEQLTTPRTLSGLNSFLNACSIDELTELISNIMKDDDTGEDITQLEAIVFGHVGRTQFALDLCKTIGEDISRGQLQKATNIVVPKATAAFKSLKKCTDRQTRDDMIRNMSDDDKSAVILYAVYEDKDNTDLINAVTSHFTQPLLVGDYQQQLGNLKNHDKLNADNYAALINSGTQLADMLKRILGD